jgi:2-methylcitrate dehydratase PrpD
VEGTISCALAELTIGTPSAAIPAECVADARKFVLDCGATALAAYDEPGVRPVLDMIREWGGNEQATCMYYGDRLPLPGVVLLNGTMIHALDYDDVHIPGALHITASVVPVALAIAEHRELTGRATLDAIVLGIEVGARLSTAHRDRRTHLGFLQASIVGGFGAVAAAARLMGLGVEETVHAFGIYYAQTCGNRQALYDTALTKRIQPAFAGKGAIIAAQLAARGFTGAIRVFEGQAGLYRIFGCAGEPPTVDELAGDRPDWQIQATAVKRYPSCGAAHPGSHMALEMVQTSDLDAEDVQSAEIFLPPESMELVGFPFRLGDSPQVNAQFSAAYAIAAAFTARRVSIHEYSDAAVIANTAARTFMDRVIVRPLAEWHGEAPDPEKTQVLRVTLRDGRVLERSMTLGVDIITPASVSYRDVQDKFFECAAYSGIMDEASAGQTVAAVDRFEDVSNVREFAREWFGQRREASGVSTSRWR